MTTRILEIRTYRLVAGVRAEFDRLVRERSLPMLARHGITVVRCEPSLVDDDHYVLMRSYASLAERDAQLSGFYGSSEWEEQHAPILMPLIEGFHPVLLEADEDAITRLTRESAP